MNTISIHKILKTNHKTFMFTDIWHKTMGDPEQKGLWLVWGAEKNGKTWFAIKLAEYLSSHLSTLYVSAEEGIGKTFKDAIIRARIDSKGKKLKFIPYVPLLELDKILEKRQSAKIIIIDNMSVYADEFKYGGFQNFIKKHKDKLIIFLAHEENKQPYTSSAKAARRFAQIIIHVEGLAAHVSGRCPGGIIYIDEQKAKLYWGETINDNNKQQ